VGAQSTAFGVVALLGLT
ncbi:unnamed protein product, partial [Rotaria sp. Silwood2]